MRDMNKTFLCFLVIARMEHDRGAAIRTNRCCQQILAK